MSDKLYESDSESSSSNQSMRSHNSQRSRRSEVIRNGKEFAAQINKKELPVRQQTDQNSTKERMIGPLTETERLEKVRRFLDKKRIKSNPKKFTYKCRK